MISKSLKRSVFNLEKIIPKGDVLKLFRLSSTSECTVYFTVFTTNVVKTVNSILKSSEMNADQNKGGKK
jgi:ribosomal silencing factor RsfS